jgi:glucan phosphoethanolaminetransferase (alkaline phosphatase superfamily)
MALFSGIIDKIGVYLFGFLVLIAILAVSFWVWSIIDCLKSKKRSKWFWLITILLLFFIGSMLYVLLEKRRIIIRRKREKEE